MNKRWLFVSVLLVLGLLLSACGGDSGGGPPVDMEKETVGDFSLESPKDWTTNSMDMFGITIMIASSADIPAESIFESTDFNAAFGDDPGVLIMAVPQSMAEEDGGMGFSADEIKALADEEDEVEVIRQGDVTIDGVKGYEWVAKGTMEDMGNKMMGVHMAVLERDSGPLVFMGFSPDKDMDKNLDIFKYMFESIKF